MDCTLMGFWIIVMAMWIFSDAVYSITLYLNAPSYEGSKKQTWARDHWVRLIRAIMGLVLMWFGWLLI